MYVAAISAVGLIEVARADTGERATDAPDEQDRQAEAEQDRRDALTLDCLDERVGGINADHHEHEKEQHHDCAGVYDDLHHAQERSLVGHVEHSEADHRERHPECAVDCLLGEDEPERTEHCEETADPEDDGLAEVNCRIHQLTTVCSGEVPLILFE